MIGKEYESPLLEAFGSAILGSAEFVDEISTTHVKGKEDVNIPALQHFASRPSPEEIMKEARAVFADNETLARQASIYLSHKYSGMRLREIGDRFNVRDTAISEASRRFAR